MKKWLREIGADAGLLYASAIWGATFIVVKDSLNYIDPVLLIAWRFLLAALVMAAFMLPARKALFAGYWRGFVLGSVLWLLYLPQTIALVTISATSSAFIVGLFVAFIPPLSILFYRTLPTWPRLLAVAVSLVGLWFVTGGLAQISFGDLLTIAAALAYALHILVADVLIKGGTDPYTLSFQQFFTVGVLSLVTALLFGMPVFSFSFAAGGYILFLALFPTLSAFLIQMLAQRVTAPIKVSLIFALEPVFAGIFAWTVGGEPFLPLKAFGGALIVLAIVISELPFGNRKTPEERVPVAEN